MDQLLVKDMNGFRIFRKFKRDSFFLEKPRLENQVQMVLNDIIERLFEQCLVEQCSSVDAEPQNHWIQKRFLISSLEDEQVISTLQPEYLDNSLTISNRIYQLLKFNPTRILQDQFLEHKVYLQA
mmetsp:Transcript_3373/g.5658  ORF Transcript_3373/g.5658 Transcript_3373/m.5658 type:complete len:125 (+) Transcript_3373:1196-1570(+)